MPGRVWLQIPHPVNAVFTEIWQAKCPVAELSLCSKLNAVACTQKTKAASAEGAKIEAFCLSIHKLRTQVGPRNHALGGASDPIQEGAILRGERAAHCKV